MSGLHGLLRENPSSLFLLLFCVDRMELDLCLPEDGGDALKCVSYCKITWHDNPKDRNCFGKIRLLLVFCNFSILLAYIHFIQARFRKSNF